jgi:hypothetical protein
MAGRFRTASRPSSTWIFSAVYSAGCWRFLLSKSLIVKNNLFFQKVRKYSKKNEADEEQENSFFNIFLIGSG